jgi:hypothetical protein
VPAHHEEDHHVAVSVVVHSVEGETREPMTEEEMRQFMERVGLLEEQIKSAGRVAGGSGDPPARSESDWDGPIQSIRRSPRSYGSDVWKWWAST